MGEIQKSCVVNKVMGVLLFFAAGQLFAHLLTRNHVLLNLVNFGYFFAAYLLTYVAGTFVR